MSEAKPALGVAVSPRGLEAALDLPNAEGVSLCLYDGDHEVFRADLTRDAGGVFRGPAPGSAPAPAMASESKALTTRRAGPASTLRTARRSLRLAVRPAVSTASLDVRIRRGQRPGRAESDRRRAAGRRAGTKTRRTDQLIIYELNLRGFSRLNPPSRKRARRPSPASPTPLRSPISRSSASPRSRSCLRTRSSTSGICPRSGWPTPGATIRCVRLARSAPRARRMGGGARRHRRAACRGHGGYPRRRLQPQRRERRVWPDAVFRGLDNAAWFRLDPSDPAHYVNDTGSAIALR